MELLGENYIQAVECVKAVKNVKQNMPDLEEYPKLRDELVQMLPKLRAAGRPLSAGIVQHVPQRL